MSEWTQPKELKVKARIERIMTKTNNLIVQVVERDRLKIQTLKKMMEKFNGGMGTKNTR